MKKKIAKEIIDNINLGTHESSNLMEFLSADFQLLLKNTLPEFRYPSEAINSGIVKKHIIIASALNKQFGFEVFNQLLYHTSDILRGLACYLIGEQKISFAEKIQLLIPVANDSNAGVREWAWLAIRENFSADLEQNINVITPMVSSEHENIRRFASELSRPRGVWCKHIKALKEKPELGLQILEPLKSDNAKYVQLSISNWLNDAGKDNPLWVNNLCTRWRAESSTKETEKICKRALRNL